MKHLIPPNEPTTWEFLGYRPKGIRPEHKIGSKTLKVPRGHDVIVSLFQDQDCFYAEVQHMYGEVIWFAWLWDTSVDGVDSKEFGYLLSDLKEVADDEAQH